MPLLLLLLRYKGSSVLVSSTVIEFQSIRFEIAHPSCSSSILTAMAAPGNAPHGALPILVVAMATQGNAPRRALPNLAVP